MCCTNSKTLHLNPGFSRYTVIGIIFPIILLFCFPILLHCLEQWSSNEPTCTLKGHKDHPFMFGKLHQAPHSQSPVVLPTAALPAIRASLWQVPFSLFRGESSLPYLSCCGALHQGRYFKNIQGTKCRHNSKCGHLS